MKFSFCRTVFYSFNNFKPSKKYISNMSTFKMVVNPILGKKEWVQKPEYYDYYQEVARSSYADMLHDTERNVKYRIAIEKAVCSMKDQGRRAKVLDIGTGTGLLSMIAARAGADSIVACEVFQPVARCAESVIKDNGFENAIKIVQKHSTDLKVGPEGDLPERVNILVAEVFDTELIGEGALRTFHHAVKELLEPDCIVVPSAATVYAQIIESPLVSRWNSLSPLPVSETQSIVLPIEATTCAGSAAVHDVQMSQIPRDQFKAISEPFKVFDFSFTGAKPIHMNENSLQHVPVVRSGTCQVVFMWWDLTMDMEGEVVLNSGPTWEQPVPREAQWRDHWMQAIYYLPETLEVAEGDGVVHLTASHDEYSLWFAIDKAGEQKSDLKSPACKCLVHVSDSHARVGMKNDTLRHEKFVTALREIITSDSICLCISDGSFLPLIAAKLGAKKVFTIESSHFHCKMIRSYIKANDLDRVVKIIEKEPTEVVESDFEGDQITVLCAEPYFVNCVQPWELVRFWHLRTHLQPFLGPSVRILPQRGVLMAVAVEFQDLHKIRAPVKSAEGFKLNKFDEMVQKAISLVDAAVEPHPLWEYPCKALSDVFPLLAVDFNSEPFRETFELKGHAPFVSPGTCNGIAIWTEYSSSKETHWSSGPVHRSITPGSWIDWYKNTQQGVYFIRSPENVSSESHSVHFEINFQLANTTIDFNLKSKSWTDFV